MKYLVFQTYKNIFHQNMGLKTDTQTYYHRLSIFVYSSRDLNFYLVVNTILQHS